MNRQSLLRTVTAVGLIFCVTAGQAAPPATPTPTPTTPGPTVKTTRSTKTSANTKIKNTHVTGNRPIANKKVTVTPTPGVRAISIAHRGTLTGRVTNAAGAALSLANVKLVAAGSHHRNRHVHPFFATMTNATGSFTFKLIRARHYQLITSKRNVGRNSRLVRVGTASTTHVNVVLSGTSAAKKHHKKHH